MPWTIEDVDSHKKGLTDKQKKQWVRIANAALKACMKKGGTDESCAAAAIKQANGVLNANSTYSVYKNKPESDYEVKLTVHQEKPHLVIPVVMMVEGVHNGNMGPLLHPIGELGKIPASWNGIPVVINHPEYDGQAISANDPEVIDKVAVGRVYNTNVDGNALKAEVWLDEDKLNEVSPQTLEEINNRVVLEVSVGVFTENADEEGDWNGEHYIQVARNHRPDHLAILPDTIGACSCADGCGLGVNQNDNDMDLKTKFKETVRRINESGFALIPIGNNEEQGYNERMQLVREAIYKMDSDGSYHYMEELFDSEVIYTKSTKDSTKMYKQGYELDGGKVKLIGSAVEVRRKVEYVNNQISRTKFNKEVKMPNECAPCVKKKVDELIANSQGRWTEADREFLQTLTEEQLGKMAPIEKEVEKVVEKTVTVNALSDEDKAALTAYKAEQKAKRDKMIQDIQANSSKEQWPDEVLNGMNDDTLRRVFDSVKKEEKVYYGVNAGETVNANASAIEPLLPAGVEVEKAK